MSVLIHEQAGRRIIFCPDYRHLRQYAVSSPTLMTLDLAGPRAPKTRFVIDWSLVKMIRMPPEAPIVSSATGPENVRRLAESLALSSSCGSWSCALRMTLGYSNGERWRLLRDDELRRRSAAQPPKRAWRAA